MTTETTEAPEDAPIFRKDIVDAAALKVREALLDLSPYEREAVAKGLIAGILLDAATISGTPEDPRLDVDDVLLMAGIARITFEITGGVMQAQEVYAEAARQAAAASTAAE